MATEAWLSGPVDGVLPELQPAAHMLTQSARELTAATANLTAAQLWARPGGAASIGFHLRHIAGSTDRLLTYARGSPLSDAQRAALADETKPDQSTLPELLALAQAAIERALAELRTVQPDKLFEERLVGRARLASSVFGLLYHIAEHTVRHTGQTIATCKAV
jgi:uncharacterized damage-inducible protein DinB